jgi:hypothetical protein
MSDGRKRDAAWVVIISIEALFAACGALHVNAENLYPARCSGRIEFVSDAGEVRLRTEFVFSRRFREKRAAVSDGRKWGFIDYEGRIVTPLQYESLGDFNEGRAWACSGADSSRRCGFLNLDGSIAVNFVYREATGYDGGFAAAIDEMGRSVIVSRDGTHSATDFGSCQIRNFGGGAILCSEGAGFRFYTVPDRRPMGPLVRAASRFHSGIAAIRRPTSSMAWSILTRFGGVVGSREFEEIGEASEGLVAVRVGGLWGYANFGGNIVIEPRFTSARPFRRGFAAVKQRNRWGFIDQLGTWRIENVFGEVLADFDDNGVASVSVPPPSIGHQSGAEPSSHIGVVFEAAYIDRAGRTVWSCR